MTPVPHNELERLEALRALDLLAHRPDERFDALCRTASALFGLPIALVSIVEAERQSFKAKCGLDADETGRDVSFCAHAILSDAVMVVEDARADSRFADNPLVTGPPGIRFYAGAPLILGQDLRAGSLCVIDTEPRTFSATECNQLKDLALVVVAQLRQQFVETELRRSEAHYRLLAENTSDMIVWSTPDTTRRYVSPAAMQILGYEPGELIGTKPLDFVHPDEAEAYGVLLDDIGRGVRTRAVGRQRYRRRDGSWVWVEATFSVTRDPRTGEPDGYVAVVRDISERHEAERRIAHMARHDALTDLANRTLLEERLAQETALARRRGTEFALHCLDLDRFKAVNDTLGHHAGDNLLRTVADRLKALVRTEDTVARIGGDEFVILQVGPGQPAAGEVLARRLIEAVQAPIELDGAQVGIGVSVGIAVAPQDGTDPEGLYRKGDLALYRAKAEGRNTFRFFEAGMTGREPAPRVLAAE
ncbi:MAG TPA: sensor domain-containing diguanylate cyclase [Methylobacterium sp.]|jgi:diguanylate cyclase (GGDEF)-like protein/PAS domain S-box-containing protein